MPNLSIKDVPETWAEALRQRAARNHRSLQGELMAIVEQALGGVPADRPSLRVGRKTVAQVAADLKAKFPDGVGRQMSSIEIIRQDRDNR